VSTQPITVSINDARGILDRLFGDAWHDWSDEMVGAAAAVANEYELDNQRIREEWRSCRIRTHDAETGHDMATAHVRQLLAEVETCHRLIRRLWVRQLPGWSGESWEHTEDPPEAERRDDLTWRETAHLIRSVETIS
jgi:hypothetical protein